MGVTGDRQVGIDNGYIMAAFLLGAVTGGLAFGWLGDKIGRVRSMVISITVYSLLTGACALAEAPGTWARSASWPRWGWAANGPWPSRW